MEIKPLYRFLREDGGVTESPEKPDGAEYITRYRLIASEGKLLTDGTTETYCIDVDSADGWSEIVRRAETEEMRLQTTVYTEDMLMQMTNAELEQILYGYGRTANMNKSNMIDLILRLQEEN